MKLKIILILVVVVLFSCQQQKNKTIEFSSPNENIVLKMGLNHNGKAFYQIFKHHEVVVDTSYLGLTRNDGDFTFNMKIKNISQVKNISDEYHMISGKFSQLSYTANESTLQLINENGKLLNVQVRVFDEGLAFRYEFPETSNEKYKVLSEVTEFAVNNEATGWMSAYQPATPWGDPGYESDYLEVKSGTPSPKNVGWSFPLLFHSQNNWIYISEAGLTDNYCGSHLQHDCSGGVYKIAFPEANERLGDGSVFPESELPWKMPWRYILVADSLSSIVESSMVYHLAEPNKIDDTSWIIPGRASWEWWSSTSGRTVKNLNKFVDLAAEMGWEYSLVDAGWENMPDGTIEEVIEHAKQKNIGLLFWYNSGGRRDSSATNEEFVMFGSETRKQEMQKLKDWGIKGIKVDFFATDKQFAIRQYIGILEDAAQYNLLVNFHGCTMPRGWTRTYPHLLTMEGVRGAECYRFSKTYPEIAANYNTIAAIVRGTAGPADYTPATFSNQKYPHLTTFAHELALPLIYESGIIHMADTPESYAALPNQAKEFLKTVSAAWDETKVITAVPGELFVIARRKGENWFVAGINGKNEKQNVRFELPDNFQKGILFSDGSSISSLEISPLQKEKSISIEMHANGGFVIYYWVNFFCRFFLRLPHRLLFTIYYKFVLL